MSKIFIVFPPDLRSLPCYALFCGGDISTTYKVYYECLVIEFQFQCNRKFIIF